MRRIEFFLLALAALSLGAVDGAFSADIDRRPIAPSPLPGFAPLSWTTCYAGLNAGGVWSSFGFTGGGQVGCNWRGNYSLVWGGEADMQYTGLDGSRDVFAPTASAHQDFQSRWLATFRGRFGWLANENMYFYATGGLALANVGLIPLSISMESSTTCRLNNTCGVEVGAGLEWRFAPQWSAKWNISM